MSGEVSSFYHHKVRKSALPQDLDDVTALQEILKGRKWDRDDSEFMRAPNPGKRLFKVSIRNIRAQDLAAKDVGGTSDPYVVMNWPDGFEKKTSVVSKTLNAVWKDFEWDFEYEVDFSTNLTTKSLEISCFDKDMLKDEIIGTASVDLFTIAAGPTEYELNLMHKNEVNGLVRFYVSMKELVFPQLIVKSITLLNLKNVSSIDASVIYQHKASSRPSSEFASSVVAGSSATIKGFDVLKIKCFLEDLIDQNVRIIVASNGLNIVDHAIDVKYICPLESQKNQFTVKAEQNGVNLIAELEWLQFPNCSQMRRGVFSSSKGISKSILLIKGVLTPIVSFHSPPFMPEFQNSLEDNKGSEIPSQVSEPKKEDVSGSIVSHDNQKLSIVENLQDLRISSPVKDEKRISNLSINQHDVPVSVALEHESKSPENNLASKNDEFIAPPPFDANEIDLPSYLKDEAEVGESGLPPPGYDEEDNEKHSPAKYPPLPDYLKSPDLIPPAANAVSVIPEVPKAAPSVAVNNVVPEIKLPGGFEKKFDNSGKPFYVDNFLKTTSFDPPNQLLDGWERSFDPVKNRVFYINHVEKKTQWDPPGNSKPVSAIPVASPAPIASPAVEVSSELPKGYEKRTDPKTGKVVYIDHFLKSTSWNAPDPLPKGWERAQDPKTGKVFYIDHANKKTSWEVPKLAVAGAAIAGAAVGGAGVAGAGLAGYPYANPAQPANPIQNAGGSIAGYPNSNAIPQQALNPLAGYPMGESEPNPMLGYPGIDSTPQAIPSPVKPAEKPLAQSALSDSNISRGSGFAPISASDSVAGFNSFLGSGQRAAPLEVGKAKLPSGYEMKTDPKNGRAFYIDHYLKSTSWEAPPMLPEGWDRGFDPKKNRVYYVNHITKTTQWELPTISIQPVSQVKPAPVQVPQPVKQQDASNLSVASFTHKSPAAFAGLPEGYEQSKNKDGREFYIDHFTKTTSWERPAPLPMGWSRGFDSKSQRVFYQNNASKAIQYHLPTEAVSANPFAPVTPASAPNSMKIPEGIEVKTDPKSGKPFYVDHFLKSTSWNAPRQIPVNWERAFDAKSQRVYYIDHTRKKTQYEHP